MSKILLILLLATMSLQASYAVEKVKDREGLKVRSYFDSTNNLTVGYGHKLSLSDRKKYPLGTKVPMSQITKWLVSDIAKAQRQATAAMHRMRITHTYKIHDAFTVMYYQLGDTGGRKFKKFEEAMRLNAFDQAVKQLEGSRWFTQTPKRVTDLIVDIRIYQLHNPPFLGGA